MTHPDHWLCAPGDTVTPTTFNPPTSPNGQAVLEVVAFHRDIDRAGYTFRRAALGAVWVRA